MGNQCCKNEANLQPEAFCGNMRVEDGTIKIKTCQNSLNGMSPLLKHLNPINAKCAQKNKLLSKESTHLYNVIMPTPNSNLVIDKCNKTVQPDKSGDPSGSQENQNHVLRKSSTSNGNLENESLSKKACLEMQNDLLNSKESILLDLLAQQNQKKGVLNGKVSENRYQLLGKSTNSNEPSVKIGNEMAQLRGLPQKLLHNTKKMSMRVEQQNTIRGTKIRSDILTNRNNR